MRSRARLILEKALLPPGCLLTPHMIAQAMEEALHTHFGEEDLTSGKLYLRRLKAIMDMLELGSKKHQPAIGEILALGMPSSSSADRRTFVWPSHIFDSPLS